MRSIHIARWCFLLFFCPIYIIGVESSKWTWCWRCSYGILEEKVTVMSLFEAPGAKTLSRALLFQASECTMHGSAYRVLLTYDCLNKPKPVKQVVVAAMVIFSNGCHVWTMYLCMDSMKFVSDASGASIVWGHYYFVTICRSFCGVLLLGRDITVFVIRLIAFIHRNC